MYTVWWRILIIHAFMHGCIIPHDADTMKMYVCKLCENASDECVGCVPDKTPENFDKSIMDVFCKRKDSIKPKWERMVSYYETF